MHPSEAVWGVSWTALLYTSHVIELDPRCLAALVFDGAARPDGDVDPLASSLNLKLFARTQFVTTWRVCRGILYRNLAARMSPRKVPLAISVWSGIQSCSGTFFHHNHMASRCRAAVSNSSNAATTSRARNTGSAVITWTSIWCVPIVNGIPRSARTSDRGDGFLNTLTCFIACRTLANAPGDGRALDDPHAVFVAIYGDVKLHLSRSIFAHSHSSPR